MARSLTDTAREPRSTVLSMEDEAIIVAFRQHTLLPLDDCLYARMRVQSVEISAVGWKGRDRGASRFDGLTDTATLCTARCP